jgi:hypothetical protein
MYDNTETTTFINNKSSLLDDTETENNNIVSETNDVNYLHFFKTYEKRGKPLEKYQNACAKTPNNI